jgi:hypothetical protein
MLKRPDGLVLDQMNYGTPDLGWPNANADLWDPGVPDVPQGHMLGRKPNGYDTNQPSDWRTFVPPYATLIYPTPYESGINWSWNTQYDITWLATNPNGPDANLSIDLWYIEDTDFSTSMSTADRITPIVLGTENDGVHTWTTPSGFIGWVWVKLTAQGPENPMINTTVVSGRMYDPPVPMNDLWGELQTTIPETTLTEEELLELAGMAEGESVTSTEESIPEDVATTTEDAATTTKLLAEEEYATGITPPAPAVAETESGTTTEEASPAEEPVPIEESPEGPVPPAKDPQTVVDESTVPAVREEDTQPQEPTPVETTEKGVPTDKPAPTESMTEPAPAPTE